MTIPKGPCGESMIRPLLMLSKFPDAESHKNCTAVAWDLTLFKVLQRGTATNLIIFRLEPFSRKHHASYGKAWKRNIFCITCSIMPALKFGAAKRSHPPVVVPSLGPPYFGLECGLAPSSDRGLHERPVGTQQRTSI